MNRNIPRILLGAAGSDGGKTTVACALLWAMKEKGVKLSAFKTGPDYIDPMFHRKVLGAPSCNLDLFLFGEENARRLFAEVSQNTDLAVIEGVMGLYDGRSPLNDDCSANHLSRVLEAPTILVLDVRGMSFSAAAILHGFCTFRENRIRGVIFNRCSPGMYDFYSQMAKEQGIIPCGYLPVLPEAVLESRHLGLITADEVTGLREKLELLGKTAAETLELDTILELAKSAPEQDWPEPLPVENPEVRPVIAVAKDKAFCFYYEENLKLLQKLGASIVEFSPISDEAIPPETDGLWLGGGYPEEYAQVLSQNKSMLESVKKAVEGGLPTIAECGGFLYLLENLAGRDGVFYPMAGVFQGQAEMTGRLQHFGYAVLEAKRDNLLCKAGESIPIHEFHYSKSTNDGEDFIAHKRNRERLAAHGTDSLYAGYPHLHFYGNPDFARNFVKHCTQWKENRK